MTPLENVQEQTAYMDQVSQETGYRLGLTVLSGGAMLRAMEPSTGVVIHSPVVDVSDVGSFKGLVDSVIAEMRNQGGHIG